MNILDAKELQDSLTRVGQYPGYVLGVMFDDKSRRDEFLLHMKASGTKYWSLNMRSGIIKFKSGGSIQTFVSTNKKISPDGFRYNEILFDGNSFTNEIINKFYTPLLVPYIIEDPIDNSCEDSELNKFLNEFKVIN